MATKNTSVELTCRNQNSELVKRSYGNVNPDVTDLVLHNFAVDLNNLTTNSLQSITRVDRTDITSVSA